MSALFGYTNLLANATSVTSSGGSAAGFEPTQIQDARIYKYWAPQTSPDTLTIDLGATGKTVRVIVLVAPRGAGFLSTPTVRVRNTVGGADVWTSSVSYRPAAGLSDRRFFVLPPATTCRYVQVLLSVGDQLARVWCGDVMDVTQRLLGDWSVGVVDGFPVAEQDGPGMYADPIEATLPRRWKLGQFKLGGLTSFEAFAEEQYVVSGTVLSGPIIFSGATKSLLVAFDRQGRVGEVVMLPAVPSGTTTNDLKFLSQMSIYGRLANDLEFRYRGRYGTGVELWDTSMSIEELI